MTTREIKPAECQAYFKRVAQGLRGKEVEIEVAGLHLGDQIESQWAPLTGLTYEPRSRLLEVTTEDLDHLIRKPREIRVDEDVQGLHSVQIVDADGNRQIIKLRSPLALPRA